MKNFRFLCYLEKLTRHLIIVFLSIICDAVADGRKEISNVKLLPLTVLERLAAYKRFQLWRFDLETFGVLE